MAFPMETVMPQMIIASALADGHVVFLAGQGRWVNRIADGLVARNEFQAEKLVQTAAQAEARNEVVGPDLIKVSDATGYLQPVEIRESIRSDGPTVPGHPDERP
jgi:hypothetical protein